MIPFFSLLFDGITSVQCYAWSIVSFNWRVNPLAFSVHTDRLKIDDSHSVTCFQFYHASPFQSLIVSLVVT